MTPAELVLAVAGLLGWGAAAVYYADARRLRELRAADRIELNWLRGLMARKGRTRPGEPTPRRSG